MSQLNLRIIESLQHNCPLTLNPLMVLFGNTERTGPKLSCGEIALACWTKQAYSRVKQAIGQNRLDSIVVLHGALARPMSLPIWKNRTGNL